MQLGSSQWFSVLSLWLSVLQFITQRITKSHREKHIHLHHEAFSFLILKNVLQNESDLFRADVCLFANQISSFLETITHSFYKIC